MEGSILLASSRFPAGKRVLLGPYGFETVSGVVDADSKAIE